MRIILFLAAILSFASAAAFAQGPPAAPVYQRMRNGADHWQQRGGYGPRQGGYGGYFNPYFAPPIVAGTWYQRPYPYHFDYYRYRWGGEPQADAGVEMVPAADCPCAGPTEAGLEL